MRNILISSLSILLLLASCGDDATTENPEEANSQEENTTTEENATNEVAKPKTHTVYAWVDKLRIRESPSLKAKEVVQVAEGTEMTFAGEISDEKIKITLRGREMEAPFYKVTTADGKTGWTFAGALSNAPVDVQSYRVALAFDTRVPVEGEEDSGDWGYYLYEAGQMLVGTGIDLIYIDENYNSVEIKNGKGEIIGVENISHFVKKHETGIVCIEKGKEAKFVGYDPSMGEGILEVFGSHE